MNDILASGATPFEALGGREGVHRLAARFYAVMADDPAAHNIRVMHDDDLAPIIERLAGFLTGWLGGPRDYFEREDAPCIMSLHKRLPIGAVERDQWMHCMRRALKDVSASEALITTLDCAFLRLANAMKSR